jgi:hypothetical protein
MQQPHRFERASRRAMVGQAFQATGIIFPAEGCWQMTGKVGQATLRFVTLVIKRRPS